MKKLFISCPMRGRTRKNILKTREIMHKIAELSFGEDLEVIDSFLDADCETGKNPSIFFLGRAISKMADADYFVGIEDDENYSGCKVERLVAEEYGIKMHLVSLSFIPEVSLSPSEFKRSFDIWLPERGAEGYYAKT